MPLKLLRVGAVLASLALASALAFVPADGRGQQAEWFALLAFFLLAGLASLFASGAHSRPSARADSSTVRAHSG